MKPIELSLYASRKSLDAPLRCPNCCHGYKHKASLYNHMTYECGVEAMFECTICGKKCKRKMHLIYHLGRVHSILRSNIVFVSKTGYKILDK
ncbi:unnamed protein product [Ceutorhynchus assimilis]|uniref:C2H2-type domain-containing protein n=1 Tax=Ceutorhynchus assimilis TaxID=467358 RepID=A0A9N9MD42_9CUCU|nr:unnamed protein product [Ceutorhynchus assimilis]